MERAPSPGPHYYCSPNPSDSSEDSKKTVSPNLMIPNVGYRGQQEADSGRVVFPVEGEDETSSDTERTVSFGGIASDGHGDAMEVDSGHCNAGDQDTRSNAEKNEKHTWLKTDKGKSVDHGLREQVKIIKGKGGLLKTMLPVSKILRGTTGDSSILSKNAEMDGETGDGKTPLTDTKMVVYVPRVPKLKEQIPIPQWLKDYKSEVADSDGWEVEQVSRADSYGRKDKYYTHRDYDHIFRSTVEVKNFLDTRKVKGKGLLQKKSSDPGGQSSGSRRRSTKRRMVLPTSDTIGNPQGYGCSTSGDTAPISRNSPDGFV